MSVAFMYPVVILENKVLSVTTKTHKLAVFKNQHIELRESITLFEFWVPIDANHSKLQRIKWDAKTVQKQKATSPAHLIETNLHWYFWNLLYILFFLSYFVFTCLGTSKNLSLVLWWADNLYPFWHCFYIVFSMF